MPSSRPRLWRGSLVRSTIGFRRLPGTGADVVDLKRQSRELISRIGGLYGAVGRWTGAPTKDQLSRLAYYQTMVKQLTAKAP